MTNITIPDSVEDIGNGAFVGCSNLTSVDLGNGITTINTGTFNFCASLKEVVIPDTVKSIGYKAFSSCSNLENVTIPCGVTKIYAHAFSACEALTSVTIPDSVIYLGEYAFVHCYNLEDVVLSDNIIGIGAETFGSCKSLTKLTLPESAKYIESGAFGGCESLTELTIPAGVEYISYQSFENCDNLYIFVDENNEYYSDIDGVLFNKDKTELIRYAKDIIEPTYTVPDTVTSIGDYAFYCCEALESVTLSDNVIDIGDGVFYCCTSLESIFMPNTVLNIGYNNSAWCSSLTDVYYGGTEEEWNNINIEEGGNYYLLNADIHYNAVGTASPVIGDCSISTNTAGECFVGISLSNVEYDSQLITVFTKDGVMIENAITDISAGDTSKTIETTSNSFDEAKVFIWNSLEGMKPLCKAKSITIE
ncbi:MAG: leucine-rich repeat domain-containing protein [Firmicutes bacterium]|nr:leucine-rich repeat domain-containing protein [Bacillota bacterium]